MPANFLSPGVILYKTVCPALADPQSCVTVEARGRIEAGITPGEVSLLCAQPVMSFGWENSLLGCQKKLIYIRNHFFI